MSEFTPDPNYDERIDREIERDKKAAKEIDEDMARTKTEGEELDRLMHQLEEDLADLDEFDLKTRINEARVEHGMSAGDVIAMFGNIEEVERRLGSEYAEELQTDAEKEGEQ